MPRFKQPRAIENQFQSTIFNILNRLLPQKHHDETNQTWIGKIANLRDSPLMIQWADWSAHRMVHAVATQNASNWREAAERSMRGRLLYTAMQEELAGSTGVQLRSIARKNAALIRSVPYDVAQRLNNHVIRGQQTGMRAETIAKVLSVEFPKLTTSRVQLIARTQTAAASTDLTEARALSIGLDWFEWETSEDKRVRPAHKKMDKVLVSWHDLPSPEALLGISSTLGRYAPGRCPNCRCIPSPILTLDDVAWPHRVYTAGSIVRMTRAQFQNLSGIPARRKAA